MNTEIIKTLLSKLKSSFKECELYQDKEKSAKECDDWWDWWQDHMLNVLYKTTGTTWTTGGFSFKRYAQGLVSRVIDSPEIRCPVGVTQTAFEWEQTRHQLWHLFHINKWSNWQDEWKNGCCSNFNQTTELSQDIFFNKNWNK